MKCKAAIMLVGLTWTLAPMASARNATTPNGDIANLRFIDLERNVTPLEGGVELPSLTAGDLVGEIAFQSDQYDQGAGQYSYGVLAVFWKLEGADGYAHFSSVSQPGWEWLGRSKFVPPVVTSFDESTGAGVATFSLPVGRGIKESGPMSAATNYPHVPEDAELTMAIGWQSAMSIGAAGSLQGELVRSAQQIDNTWPDVYVTSGDFVTELPLEPETRTIRLALRGSALTPRTFTVSPVPAYRASLPGSQVTIPAGASFVEVPFTPQSVGLVKFRVVEAGLEVAESEAFRIEQLVRAKELDPGGVWALSGPNGAQQEVEETPLFDEGKLCVEGFTPWGPAQPLYVTCSKCEPNAANAQVCCGEPAPGTDAGPMTFSTPTACVGDPGLCLWTLTPPYELSTYRFSSKTAMIKCKAITLTATLAVKPFGVGGAVTTTTETPGWQVCCTYAYDPTTPSGEFTNGRTCC